MLDRYSILINEMLERTVSDRTIPKTLRTSMAYSLLSDGKRLRPRICLACCEMLGGNVVLALPLACGIEMIHAYSLIHDDLPCMDNDDYRRGRLSNHKVFGEAGATLAGDALLTSAFEWMLVNAPQSVEELRCHVNAMRAIAIGAGASGMVAGQSLELSAALEDRNFNLEEIHMLKTGALIKAAALAGGYSAGADGSDIQAIQLFAEHFGALFQITDDILDTDREKAGVKNYASVYGLRKAHEMAESKALAAREALVSYGEKAAYLLTLIENTRHRSE